MWEIVFSIRFPGGIEPAFFRKPSSRQEGDGLLHLECEIEALPRPDIRWDIYFIFLNIICVGNSIFELVLCRHDRIKLHPLLKPVMSP